MTTPHSYSWTRRAVVSTSARRGEAGRDLRLPRARSCRGAVSAAGARWGDRARSSPALGIAPLPERAPSRAKQQPVHGSSSKAGVDAAVRGLEPDPPQRAEVNARVSAAPHRAASTAEARSAPTGNRCGRTLMNIAKSGCPMRKHGAPTTSWKVRNSRADLRASARVRMWTSRLHNLCISVMAIRHVLRRFV